MEISFDRSQMLKAVNVSKNFAETSSGLKVLQSTFLSAGFGRVRLTTTDLSLWCQVELDARTPEPGTAAVPVRTMGTVLKTLPHSRVSLRKEGDDVRFVAGSSEVRVTGLDPDEYPEINPPQGRLAAIPLPAALVNKVAYAVSKDETRYTLGGVCIEVGAAGLKLVATDGHRLARYSAASLPPGSVLDADLEEPVTAIVPVRLLYGRRPLGLPARRLRDAGAVREGGLHASERLGDALGRPDRRPVPGLRGRRSCRLVRVRDHIQERVGQRCLAACWPCPKAAGSGVSA